jgi:hypothetical protein
MMDTGALEMVKTEMATMLSTWGPGQSLLGLSMGVAGGLSRQGCWMLGLWGVKVWVLYRVWMLGLSGH